MSKKQKSTSKNALSLSHNTPVKKKLIPSVSALNESQKEVLRNIANPANYINFISGVAGSGKTFCSTSWGLEQFAKEKYAKLIFTRPYVEAGEKLGFLPGTFDDKIAPFMLPIFDVLKDHFTCEEIEEKTKKGEIMTLPLAYMRGYTFKNAFVLLDEAQNTTRKQMHLFLTRIGQGSKIVVTGDPFQSDLGHDNGFVDALRRLKGVEGVSVTEMDPKYVVRHGIIPSINDRYLLDNPLN